LRDVFAAIFFISICALVDVEIYDPSIDKWFALASGDGELKMTFNNLMLELSNEAEVEVGVACIRTI
jgi:hypothetical protein